MLSPFVLRNTHTGVARVCIETEWSAISMYAMNRTKNKVFISSHRNAPQSDSKLTCILFFGLNVWEGRASDFRSRQYACMWDVRALACWRKLLSHSSENENNNQNMSQRAAPWIHSIYIYSIIYYRSSFHSQLQFEDCRLRLWHYDAEFVIRTGSSLKKSLRRVDYTVQCPLSDFELVPYVPLGIEKNRLGCRTNFILFN